MVEQTLTLAEKELGLEEGAFPFTSRFLEVNGAKLHYVDEGDGPLLFMIHGNPTWSFLYRNLIADLKDRHRCISVDLAGFGLSVPPKDFSFKPEHHAKLIAAFIDNLDLRDATLVAHDWGGPIGFAAATATTGRITRLCFGNTWAWPVNGDFHFEWFSKLFGGPIGQFMAERYCVFINVLMPAFMKRRKLTSEEMTAFRAPFREAQSRRPMHVFPWEITHSRQWLSKLVDQIPAFKGRVCFIWPEDDVAFRKQELARWQSLLPQAETTCIKNCGHYLWLDAPEECAAVLRSFMSSAS
jgi:haloalkane dehalogenase